MPRCCASASCGHEETQAAFLNLSCNDLTRNISTVVIQRISRTDVHTFDRSAAGICHDELGTRNPVRPATPRLPTPCCNLVAAFE